MAVDLTPRRRQVLCLLALSNREIAAQLGISHQTVKNHLTAICRHVGLGGSTCSGKRVLALWQALRLDLITPDEIEPPPLVPLPGWDRERFGQMRAAAWREYRNVLA